MKSAYKLGSIAIFACVLSALSPAPNLVPEARRVHTPISASQKDLERFQGLAKVQGEVGAMPTRHREAGPIRDADSSAAHALKAAQSHYTFKNSAQAAAALKEAEDRLEAGKRSPLSILVWLLVAASFGYGFIFFVRHWADKNIPTPRSVTPKW